MRGLPLRLHTALFKRVDPCLGRPQTDLSPGNARRDRYAMNVHEYQAKELLKEHGIAVPAGHAALSVAGSGRSRQNSCRVRFMW